MKNAASSRRLSAVDAGFLYFERKELPLHIASVSVFDGPIPFDEFVASIASKLHLVPRYRQIVVMPPRNLGLPTWEDDPHFDIRRHIFRVSLDRPGGEAELEALAGRIFSQLLDRSKPLWDIHVVDGLKDGRGAVIWREHHALADGLAGARLLQVMAVDEALKLCVDVNHAGGIGHTAVVFSCNEEIIRKFGEVINAGRIIVNSPGSIGAIGGVYNDMVPTLSFGCGTGGGNSPTDNVNVYHYLNIKRKNRKSKLLSMG